MDRRATLEEELKKTASEPACSLGLVCGLVLGPRLRDAAVVDTVTAVDGNDHAMEGEDPVATLKRLEELVLKRQDSKVGTRVILQPKPLLSVFVPVSADFLGGDQPAARISCPSDGAPASLRAYNGFPFKVADSPSDEDLLALVDDLVRITTELTPCRGFDADDQETGVRLFARIRKSDLPALLVERCGLGVVYRSRSCRMLFHADDEEAVCPECREMFSELDKKYCAGQIAAEKATKVEVTESGEEAAATVADRGLGKRKSKKKKFFGDDFVVIKMEEETSASEKENGGGDDEVKRKAMERLELKMADEEEGDDDEDFSVRKSGRKRRSNFRLTSGTGKRGRPPILIDPVSCQECGETFVVAREYRHHILSHTNAFACQEKNCSRLFKTQEELDVHVRRHRGQAPFACTDCDAGFPTLNKLRLHRQSHTGVKPFPCSLCPKTFARAQQRLIHMAVHSGERAHLCAECGRSFGSASTLIDHKKRKHLEIRDYKCPDCPKAFFGRQELVVHARTHTGDKPFQCTHCGKAFSRTHHLKRHLAVHLQEQKEGKDTVKKDNASSTVEHILKLEGLEGGGTILVAAAADGAATTTADATEGEMQTIVLSEGADAAGYVYIVDGQRYVTSIASDGTPVLIPEKEAEAAATTTVVDETVSTELVTTEKGPADATTVQLTTVSGDAATSLIELSQGGGGGQESAVGGAPVGETVLVEIPSDHPAAMAADGGGYIMVTTEGEAHKLVSVEEQTVTTTQEEVATTTEIKLSSPKKSSKKGGGGGRRRR